MTHKQQATIDKLREEIEQLKHKQKEMIIKFKDEIKLLEKKYKNYIPLVKYIPHPIITKEEIT